MGLLDKLKNVFFEEEEVEVEEKPKKEKIKKDKPIVKKIENPKKEKKEEKQEVKEQPIVEEKVEEDTKDLDLDLDFTKVEDDIFEEDQDVMEENDLLRRPSDQNFKFPVILDEDESSEEPVFKDEYKEVKWDNNIYGDEKIEVEYKSDYHKEPYSNSYTKDLEAASYSLRDIPKEEKTFKPSPVISPVYGVLDLNYTKEDVKEKKKPEREPIFSFSSNKLDLDDVRAKAYGLNDPKKDIAKDIEDDIEQDDIDVDIDFEEANETIDMTNGKPVVDSVTVGDAEEYFEDLGLEYNVDYKDSKKKGKAKKEEEEEIPIEEIPEDEPVITDKPKRKKKVKEEENDIDVDIEDNLFDLIDSMYDEGE